ncbi:MAG: PhzF family phenazine biosynthesis isomerase [Myxococcota bacterium]
MNQTEFPLLQVDAFTDKPFGGNPAAVCLLGEMRDDAWLQAVAAEMNLAETAFLVAEGDRFHLRWFTPKLEVPLCGHATLASAHALWEAGTVSDDRSAIHFRSASGELVAHRGEDGFIELDFPALSTTPIALSDAVSTMLVGDPAPQVEYSAVVSGKSGPETLLVQLASEDQVRRLTPALHGLRYPGGPGVIVTARAGSDEFDFVSRFFFPSAGIDEDPATGSAHCALTPFWSERLGKTEMTAYQASPRGAVIGVRLDGDRVRLCGRAVTVLRGTLIA